MESFSERLVTARENSGYTQEKVAEYLDRSYQAVSLWERGKSVPGIFILNRLAKLYHVTTD